MVNILLILSGGVFCGFLFATDFVHVVRELVLDRIDKFNQLQDLVGTVHQRTFWRSLSIVWNMMVMNCKQMLNGHLVPKENGMYELSCVIKGRLHKIMFTPHRGPLDVLMIMDENRVDCTEEILPFILSHKATVLTPGMLNKKGVVFVYDDKEVAFGEHDVVGM